MHTLQHAPDIRLATQKKEAPPPGQRDSPQVSASSTGAMRGPGRQRRLNSDKGRVVPRSLKCRPNDPRAVLNAMWLLFQCVVMIAVGWTGIYYEWTPNRVALG